MDAPEALLTLEQINSASVSIFSESSKIKIIRTPTLVEVQHKNDVVQATQAHVSLKLGKHQRNSFL